MWLLLEQSKMPVPVKFPHTASCLLLGRLFVSNLIFLWHNVLFAVADKPDAINGPVCHFFFSATLVIAVTAQLFFPKVVPHPTIPIKR